MQGSPVQYEFEDLSPVEKRLKVEVAKEHVTGKLEQAYKKLSREVNIRGFRPGKAPREMLEKMYGKRVEFDVTQELLRDTLSYVAQQTQVRMVGQPVLEAMPEVKKNEVLRYSARIELFPSLELKDWEGVEASRRAAKASDEEVSAVLERKRGEHIEMLPLELDGSSGGRTQTQASDTVVVSLKGEIGANKFDGDEVQLDLGAQRGPIPGLSQALLGVPLSAVDHEVRFTMPEGARPELAGKEITLLVTIKQAYEKKLPSLDDDFAKDTGEAETMDELRQKVREQILKEDEKEAKEEARIAILDEVVKRNPVPLPPSLIKRFSDQFFDMQRQQALIAALQAGKDIKQEGIIDEAKLREEALEEAVRSLSKEFILMTLSEKESLEATQADVEKRLAEMARQSDKSVGRVRAEMQKDDPQLDHLRSNIRLEKALDLLESRAKIVEAGP